MALHLMSERRKGDESFWKEYVRQAIGMLELLSVTPFFGTKRLFSLLIISHAGGMKLSKYYSFYIM